MSTINDLIAEHCPDGVPFEPLRDVGTWYGGGTPSKQRVEYWRNGTIPWLSPKDMGKSVVVETQDYITEAAVAGSATKLVPANSVAVVVRSSILDRVLPVALIPMPVTLNQDMKAIVPRDGIMPEYVLHVLLSRGPQLLRHARKSGASVASIDMPKFLSFKIPVPPLHVQREITRILDKLERLKADLEAELEAELELRKRQYAFYRDALLDFNSLSLSLSLSLSATHPMGEIE